MVKKIGAVVAKEIREGLPSFIFFLFMFHMIALTKAVSLGDYSITSLRATVATVGALIVAKAVLVVEALPIARLFSGRRVNQVLWKTLLFAMVVLLFRFVEEIIPLSSKHGRLAAAFKALFHEISWPIFGVLTLWILGGLLLYCLASELVREVGLEKVREMLFGAQSGNQTPAENPFAQSAVAFRCAVYLILRNISCEIEPYIAHMLFPTVLW